MTDRRSTTTAARAAIAPLFVLLAIGAGGTSSPADDLETRWREPVAIVASADGAWLAVANRESGTLSVIDARRLAVSGEVPVGQSVSDLAATADGVLLIGVDELAHRAVLLSADGPKIERIAGVDVPSGPVGVAIDPSGSRAFVTSLWPRVLTVLEIDRDAGTLRVLGSVDLPFEPRRVAAIGEHRAVVADAFGGFLAVVDGQSCSLDSVRELPAHNIRGLALNLAGDRLLVTHQKLNRAGRTDMNDIHWAGLIGGVLRSIPLAALHDPGADLVASGSLQNLSDVGSGGGDPNGVIELPDGRVAVALGGVDRVAFGSGVGTIGQKVRSGRRPVALTRIPGGDRVAVANAFDDSVSILSLGGGEAPISITLGPQPEADPARLGRALFYDASLSHDGWMSCHSCHTDGHSNGVLVDTLGDNSYGTPKRTLSLLGVGETDPWAWDGGIGMLGDQIKKSVVSTMRGYPLYLDEAKHVEAYLRSLPPPPALISGDHPEHDAEAVARGSSLFRSLRCDRCHAPPTYTTPKVYDIGLVDERGRTEFNPPSLRGVGRRRAFFHDGQVKTLEDVFHEVEHQLDEPLDEQRLADLIAFLRSL